MNTSSINHHYHLCSRSTFYNSHESRYPIPSKKKNVRFQTKCPFNHAHPIPRTWNYNTTRTNNVTHNSLSKLRIFHQIYSHNRCHTLLITIAKMYADRCRGSSSSPWLNLLVLVHMSVWLCELGICTFWQADLTRMYLHIPCLFPSFPCIFAKHFQGGVLTVGTVLPAPKYSKGIIAFSFIYICSHALQE